MWNSPLPIYPVWMISSMRRYAIIPVAVFLLFAGGSTTVSCAREDGREEPSPPQSESPDSRAEDTLMTPPEEDVLLVEIVEGESDAVQVRANGRVFHASRENPGFSGLKDVLIRRKKEFKPTGDAPALRVLVRQGKGVDFTYVLAVLKVCENAGVTNIRFEAAPDPIAEEIERLEREEATAKQK
jgi:biopolymer transport protein ExbD